MGCVRTPLAAWEGGGYCGIRLGRRNTQKQKALFCASFREGNCRALDVLLYITAVVLISVFHDTHRGGLPVFTRHLEEGALVALRRKEKREENED